MHTTLSRRQFIMALAAAPALGLGLAGCTSSARDIRFFGTGTLDIGSAGWSHLLDEKRLRLSFKDNGNDAGPVIAQMTAGTAAADYDLGGLLGGGEGVLAAAGALQPWDLAKVPNWNTAWPWAKSIEHTRWKGEQFGIPLVVNADSMIY